MRALSLVFKEHSISFSIMPAEVCIPTKTAVKVELQVFFSKHGFLHAPSSKIARSDGRSIFRFI